jgi:hypothetical protein
MPIREWNAIVGNDKLGLTRNTTATAVTGGATTLGGSTAVRVIVDDAVAGMSKHEALRILEVVAQRVTEDAWPPA